MPRWQIGVCLLLAAMILYNPFLAGAECGSGLCVRHAASNRATVGASELQKFSPASASRMMSAAELASVQHLSDLPASAAARRRPGTADLVFFTLQIFSASLRFRPPPAV